MKSTSGSLYSLVLLFSGLSAQAQISIPKPSRPYFDCRPILIARAGYEWIEQVRHLSQQDGVPENAVLPIDEKDWKKISRSSAIKILNWVNASFVYAGRKPKSLLVWSMRNPLPFDFGTGEFAAADEYSNLVDYLDWIREFQSNPTDANYTRMNHIIDDLLISPEGSDQICQDQHPNWKRNVFDLSRGYSIMSLKEAKRVAKQKYLDPNYQPSPLETTKLTIDSQGKITVESKVEP